MAGVQVSYHAHRAFGLGKAKPVVDRVFAFGETREAYRYFMQGDLFGKVGEVIGVLDTDGTSAVENVEAILLRLIANGKADAFFTCGSNRLFQLMKGLGKEHGIPGQIAMEQIMACGLGPCYVCVRTFEVDGKQELRRVCIEGPVFDLQEALGW